MVENSTYKNNPSLTDIIAQGNYIGKSFPGRVQHRLSKRIQKGEFIGAEIVLAAITCTAFLGLDNQGEDTENLRYFGAAILAAAIAQPIIASIIDARGSTY